MELNFLKYLLLRESFVTLLFFFCLGSHLSKLTKGDGIMSFNPITVILQEKAEESTYQKSIKTIKDIYHSNVESISNAIITAHKELINIQKNMFSEIKDEKYKVTNTSVSTVLSKKFDRGSNIVFDILDNKITENTRSLLSYVKDTKNQIISLKKLFSSASNYGLAKSLYVSKGIGFRTISLPDNSQYIESIHPYSKAFGEPVTLNDNDLFKKFDKCYTSKQYLSEKMYDSITYYFKPDKSYEAHLYVDIYDDMNKDMISMLSEHKKRYKEIREMIQDIHDDRTGAYDRYIIELDKKYISDNEREEKKRTATNNYRVLTNSLLRMIDLVTVYHKIQLKILLMSYENYKNIIQTIFDDYIGDD